MVTAVDRSGNESVAVERADGHCRRPPPASNAKFTFTDRRSRRGRRLDQGHRRRLQQHHPGRGWVRQDSLGNNPATPLDFTAQHPAADPHRVTDLQNRVIHLQYGDIVPVPSTTNGTLTPGAWETAVPNGRYTVTATVGDQPGAAKTGCAAPCYDSQHTIRAEGVTAINRFQATAAVRVLHRHRHRRRHRRQAHDRRHRRHQHQAGPI